MTLEPDALMLAIAGVVVVLTGIAAFLHPHSGSGWRRLGAAAMVLGIALRPGWGTSEPVRTNAPVDVVVMVDRTTSMAAEDGPGGQRRLQEAAADIAGLIERLPGARYCVIAFDNNARVVLPFSTDSGAAITAVSAMGWREAFYGTGSDIGVGVDKAAEMLQLSTQQGSRQRFLVYAGDGEQTIDTPPKSLAPLRPMLTGSLVLGYGTAAGGPMLERPGATNHVTQNGQQVLSHLDEKNLQAIAEQTGGSYQHRPEPEPPQLPVASASAPTPTSEPRQELLWPFGLVAAGLLVWELAVLTRRWWITRKELL